MEGSFLSAWANYLIPWQTSAMNVGWKLNPIFRGSETAYYCGVNCGKASPLIGILIKLPAPKSSLLFVNNYFCSLLRLPALLLCWCSCTEVSPKLHIFGKKSQNTYRFN
jgi:hypothetical protein